MQLRYVFTAIALTLVLADSAAENFPAAFRQSTPFQSLPPFDENSVTVITSQPVGELKYYTRSGFVVDMTEEGPVISDQSNSLISVVFADNNEVWIKNPISNDMRDSWVKGTLQQDKRTISVKTGQFIDYMPSLVFGRQLWALDFNPATNMYSINPNITEIKYILSDDKIELDGTSQQRIIGSIFRAKGEVEEEHHYEGTWSGYGNYGSVYTINVDQPVIVPASASREDIIFRGPVYCGGQWNMKVMNATLHSDGNDIYLSGFCSSGPLFTNMDWTIKGKKENNQLIFPSGQFLGSYYDNPYYMTSTIKNSTEPVDLIFYPSDNEGWESDNMILFNMSSNPDPYFYYDGATLSNQPLPELTTPPISARPHLFKMSYKGYIPSIDFYYDSSANVTIAAYDGKVYIKGLCTALPESWIEGNIVGDKVVFKSPQYLGSYSEQNPEIWFMSFGSEFDKPLDSIEFDYDKVSGSLSNASSNISVSICNRRNHGLNWYFNPFFEMIEINPATPANPTDLQWKTYDWDPNPTFIFEIPTKDIDGNELIENWLYYRIYIQTNGEIIEFQMTPEEYPDMNLSTPISLFPYNFRGYDVVWTAGHHNITIRGENSNISRIGVQSLYDAGGMEQTSEIVWLDITQTGIKDIPESDDENEIFYNLHGLRVYGNLVPGIYIRNGKKIAIH